MRDRLSESRTVSVLLFLLMVFAPLILTALFGWPRIPSWDNCTIGWAIPC